MNYKNFVIDPSLVPAPVPVVAAAEPVPVVGLAPRPFVKRNENTEEQDYKSSPKTEESSQLPKKQYKKPQGPRRQNSRPKYYVPSQQPF